MIAGVIDDNYERIRSDLVRLGLTYDPAAWMMWRTMSAAWWRSPCLRRDMILNLPITRYLDTIGEKSLPEIQHQTLLNLDKKFQRMKNFTYLFGLSAAIVTIVGSLFKRMHWPGAGILITVGMVLIVFVFLPLYFITNHREQVEKKNPVYAIVGYLTIAFLLAAATFKIMHWPGAGFLIYGAVGFILIGFIPLYVVNVFKRSGKEKANLPYFVMLLVGIASVMLMGNVNMGKNALDMYMNEALANENRSEEVQERTALLLDRAQDSIYADQLANIAEIHDQARDLQVMIQDMQQGMLAAVGQSGVAIEEIKGKDNKMAGREAIINNGAGEAFILESRKFRAMLYEVVNDPVTNSQIEDHMEYISLPFEYEHGRGGVTDSPLMKNYFKNTDASKGIALAEYVAISFLLHQ
jgi:NADH:ubiquinone oxidoreductase subunit 6 (subunit J)